MAERHNLLKAMSQRGGDDMDTPEAALLPVLQYLPAPVWEPCPGRHALTHLLERHGKPVIETEGDFLVEPWPNGICQVVVTNPPFSKKSQFIARCMELGKPWALLLPVTTLGVRACQKHLHDAEIIFLPKRIDFTGKKAPWFAVAWFTWGLNIGKQLTFWEG